MKSSRRRQPCGAVPTRSAYSGATGVGRRRTCRKVFVMVRFCFLGCSTGAGRLPNVNGDHTRAGQSGCRTGGGLRGLQNLQICPAPGVVGCHDEEGCRVRACHVLVHAEIACDVERSRTIGRASTSTGEYRCSQGTPFSAPWEWDVAMSVALCRKTDGGMLRILRCVCVRDTKCTGWARLQRGMPGS